MNRGTGGAAETGAAALVVVVTGMSGAGKTVAVNALEDLGFFCVDNLPPPVVSATLAALQSAGEKNIALGIDVRARDYLAQAKEVVQGLLERRELDTRVIYLDASDELLSRRFGATRRPHPLIAHGATGVRALFDGIRRERELMAPLRSHASVVLDTTSLSVHELRREVVGLIGERTTGRLLARIISFGFKYGAPRDADVVLDARFLPNPHFDEALRPLSGRDAPVRDFVFAQPDTMEFAKKALDLIEFCLPRFLDEGKAYATFAIGCTGGRHRSVALVEYLIETLKLKGGAPSQVDIEAFHRDMGRPEHGDPRAST